MQLIITEKDNAARRIADILSDGGADAERRNGVNVYGWGGKRCVGLSGHVVGVDFPPEYNDWRDVEPVELIDADIVKSPTKENIVATLRSLAREADEAVIATDYDREGELIGKEAYELIREETDIPIQRVRFSSITDNEVRKAFSNPDDLDFDLAAAGEARQIIDLIWGAALTRFLSLSARQLGDDFISVGRVQSPTLKLIVDREREIEAFDPEDYWELVADLVKDDATFEAQYFYDDDGSEAERVWDESQAQAVFEHLSAQSSATVSSVRRRTRRDDPPAPFNTTAFIRAAGSLGYSAQRAMSIAEELYTEGYLTYPRTDNTVYPEDLDPEELLDAFVSTSPFGDDAVALLDQDDIEPTRGETESTDHPPIHPTGEFPDRNKLDDDAWEVYVLVVRRFFATVAEPATWEHLRVVAETDEATLKANGKRLLEEGYHAVYPYSSASENIVPDVEEGEQLRIDDVELEAKQTQPPRRYGQSRLISKMEEMGVGTKCLTEDTTVLCRDDSGDVVRTAIGDLFERGKVVAADGDVDIAVNENGPTTLSYVESEGSITERSQTVVSERSLEDEERVLEISTENGSFSVTDDHLLYVATEDGVGLRKAGEVEHGDRLLTTRRAVDEHGQIAVDTPVSTWEQFATSRCIDDKLYGTDGNDVVREHREQRDESQRAFAERYGSDQTAISDYENGNRDVPVWLLGALEHRPERLHGLNYDTAFENPFPLYWSSALARIVGNLLGDGSVHVNENENIVDVRYHNTDRRLVDRFVTDIESIFGIEPTVSGRAGREDHHRRKYQVNLPTAVGRVLQYVLETVTENGCPVVPEPLQPTFVGALFDDEGHVSRDRKAFISNTDHDLLDGVAKMLAEQDIETSLDTDQHKLYIRGRKNLERFFEVAPIATDEKFFRAVDGLRDYAVTETKAEILELTATEPRTTDELAVEVGRSRGRVQDHIRALREEGHLTKHVEGSNASKDGLRTIRYSSDTYRDSLYATLRGTPSSTRVVDVRERDYDGEVYDLSIDPDAPNFAVEGGVIVHNSTRHNVVQKLYDRGYVDGDPPQPTALAKAVVEAAETFADLVVSEEMTAQLEADMTAIAEGEATLDDITAESREMLERVFEELHDSREAVGEHLQESLKADRTVGPCPECGSDLLVRRSRHGSYFVGCDGYPDCRYTLPLPSTGEPLVLDEVCEEHDTKHVKMLAGGDTFVHGCPRCQAEAADENEDEIIGVCPDCGAEEGGELAIKHLRSGSRLVGCTRYPDCDYSLPLPRRGEIVVQETRCEEHDLPHIHIVDDGDDDDPWELGCPICNYEEYQARNAVEDLEDLNGVGAKTAEKLADAGVESPEDLAGIEPDAVAEQVQGVSADRIREWQTEVKAS